MKSSPGPVSFINMYQEKKIVIVTLKKALSRETLVLN